MLYGTFEVNRSGKSPNSRKARWSGEKIVLDGNYFLDFLFMHDLTWCAHQVEWNKTSGETRDHKEETSEPHGTLLAANHCDIRKFIEEICSDPTGKSGERKTRRQWYEETTNFKEIMAKLEEYSAEVGCENVRIVLWFRV